MHANRFHVHEPSPEQIAAECERIQRGWSPTARTARIVDDQTRHLATEGSTTPLVDTHELANLDDYDAAVWGG